MVEASLLAVQDLAHISHTEAQVLRNPGQHLEPVDQSLLG